MSAEASGDAWNNSPLRHDQLLVHLAIADVVNDAHDNRFWMHRENLATKAKVSVKTVDRALSALVSEGWMELLEAGGGRALAAEYRYFPGGKGRQIDAVSEEKGDSESRKGDNLSNASSYTTKETQNSLSQVFGDEHPAYKLAHLLADLIHENGSKRPKVTASWCVEIDRLMRLDGRSAQQVENMIRWCQRDSFWRGNILSAKKLREKYDQMRLKAMQERRRQPAATPADRAAEAEELRRTWGNGEIVE